MRNLSRGTGMRSRCVAEGAVIDCVNAPPSPLVTRSPSFLSEPPLALASGKKFSSLSGHVRINSRRKLKHLDELANHPLHKNRPLGLFFRYSGLSNRAGPHKLLAVTLNAVQRDRQGNTRIARFHKSGSEMKPLSVAKAFFMPCDMASRFGRAEKLGGFPERRVCLYALD